MSTRKIDACNIDSRKEQPIESVECLYEEIAVCPICHHAIVTMPLEANFIFHRNQYSVFITFFCPNCENVFLAKYHAIKTHAPNLVTLSTYRLVDVSPKTPIQTPFSTAIENLSSGFITTYHQSEIAEVDNLTEIAGCGYRKALEYLVKDYLCHKSPDDAEVIKAEFLGNAIKRITDKRIKTLVERATWLGNDETHYVKKHKDRDTEDIRRFINAVLHYIESELAFEDALSIPHTS